MSCNSDLLFQVAGMSFTFNPDRPAGNRINRSSVLVQNELVLDDKLYRLCTKGYLAGGKDGFDCFAGCRIVLDEENGPVLSTIVQNHFKSVQIMLGQQKARYSHRQSIIPVNRRKSVACPLTSLMRIESNDRLLEEEEESSAFGDLSASEHLARLAMTPNSTRLHRRRTVNFATAFGQRRHSIQNSECSEVENALSPKVDNRIRIVKE